MSRSLRVALLTSARSWRGSSAVFAVVADGLRERRHMVQVLVANEELAAGFAARDRPVRVLPVQRTSLRAARALRAALLELRPDVLLADKARDVRLTALARPRHPPLLVYCISTPRPATDLGTRLASYRVGLTVFLTQSLARSGLAVAPVLRRAPHRVIPNGVDCELFRPDAAAGGEFRARMNVGAGPLLVGVGALAPEKRWDLLLESAALLPPPRPPLVLCGVGGLQHALQARGRELGVDVRFAGRLTAAELVGAYNAATVVVHSRPDEVFSLTLVEALACGRPVLAVRGGGTPELLGDAGVLAPPDDAPAFARAIGELLGDAPRREALGAAARQRATAHLSVERMVRAYVETIEGLA